MHFESALKDPLGGITKPAAVIMEIGAGRGRRHRRRRASSCRASAS